MPRVKNLKRYIFPKISLILLIFPDYSESGHPEETEEETNLEFA